MVETIKGFQDYTSSDYSSETLPEGTYRLKVTGGVVTEWSDGRPKLDITTEVMEGEHNGRYGPRHTWSLGESDGVTKDGREFHVDAESQKYKLGIQATTIHNGKPFTLSNEANFNETMLDEIGKQLVGDEFIGVVVQKNGYPAIAPRGIYSMSAPPSSYRTTATFSLDNV